MPLKEFDYNAKVELINTVTDTVKTATFQGVDVDWYIEANDIMLKHKPAAGSKTPLANIK